MYIISLSDSCRPPIMVSVQCSMETMVGSIAESKSCLSVLINGKFWVCVFCVLSGLVQGYKIFSMEGLDRLPKDMVKRYFRLSLPVFFISLIVYLMMKAKCFIMFRQIKLYSLRGLEHIIRKKRRWKMYFILLSFLFGLWENLHFLMHFGC